MKEEQDASQAAATPERKLAIDLARRQRLPLGEMRKLGIVSFGKRTFAAAMKDDILGRAAQLAYYFFFAIFPMLIAASALLGLAAKTVGDLNNELLGYMATVIPPSAYQIVADTFHQTTHASSGKKVLLGALVALWSASVGTAAIQDSLNAVNQIDESRPFWKARLNAIALTIAMGVIFLAALVALFGGDRLVEHRHAGYGILAVIAVRLLTWPLAYGLVALGFSVVYWKAPALKNQPWEWVTPGAAIGTLVWIAASLALRVYLHYFDSYSVTYGSLGAVIVLLTWFYISGLALLLGAVINDTLTQMYGEVAQKSGASKDLSSVTA